MAFWAIFLQFSVVIALQTAALVTAKAPLPLLFFQEKSLTEGTNRQDI